ncbi:hypothetical protein FXN63_14145 [Pigmentiphaga aceris]|uniref:Uncharacterized protein n=1 Tax=Pigmentiphaga aceris TaxID=1940612 RepID=A0A5C0AWZ2_9BURK|nr:hypothetical protein [Pigmentiphaga aceris]QEI06848.1 hypothetical protein FXN63_14145 [Pigmentiphaga aceris]
MTDTPAAIPTAIPLGRYHLRRLRTLYRSAGWPSQDVLEIELLASGMAERVSSAFGQDTIRVTDAGIRLLAEQASRNRTAMSAHEALVERVAHAMLRAGRIAWRGLALRAQLPASEPSAPARWCVAKPDVFSIRNTTVETYVEPIVHEIKVSRADLLGDLKRPDKRTAYLDMGECWYVLGRDAKGREIADPSEIPPDCGVLVDDGVVLQQVRRAAPAARAALPFGVWMALAKASPVAAPDNDAQAVLGAGLDSPP